jgi:DNA recombination protein RmuC
VSLDAALERQEREIRGELARMRSESLETARADRTEQTQALERLGQGLAGQVGQLGTLQAQQFEGFGLNLTRLTQSFDARVEQLRLTVETRLTAIQADNSAKLEEMRKTVDEKLHATLEQRLGESFKLVSDRLEQVHRGLGEMQTLAAGVGDLKKVLTNVKTRGTWGEVQLAALLDQVLTAEQYASNVATRPGSNDRVEFAIRLPGREVGEPVWLPIDAKFPSEDYQRLVDAQERADVVGVEAAGKALETRLKDEARTIREKYIQPPHTTDFAILYLPTEGLYAEALRRPGLAEALQRDQRVSLAGPTTLAAMLNSLQMGFRTLAIEQRSSEVWAVLGAVKTEFGKFGEALAHTKKKLQEASNTIDKAEVRTRAVTRKLKEVEALPAVAAVALIGESLDDAATDDADGDE